jgi:uncharacterized protein
MSTTSATETQLTPAALEQHLPEKASSGKRKIIWLLLGSFLILIVSLILAFHAFIAWTLARPIIAPLSSNPMKAVKLPYEDIRFSSSNGSSNLEGWYIPAASGKDASTASDKTVIFSHGYGGNREELWVPLYNLAKELNKRHYNVVMFDYGYVQPGSERIVTAGVQESKELLGAVQYARERGAKEVYVWGFSMGAGTALQAALHSDDITGMILDSTFILNADTLYHNMKQYVDLPKFPSLNLVRLFFPLINGVSLNQVPFSSVTNKKYDIPIFFIHGTDDTKAPYEIIEGVYDHQKENASSKLWIYPGGQHELIYRADPKEYIEKTMNFLHNMDIPRNVKVAYE